MPTVFYRDKTTAGLRGPWDWLPQRRRFRRGVLVLFLVGVAIVGGIAALDLPWPGSPEAGAYVTGYALMASVLLAYLAARRESLGHLARQFGVWLGVALLLVVGYGYRHEISGAGERLMAILVPSHGYRPDPNSMTFRAAADGHYWIDARANGVKLRFLVDTGASSITLSKADARRLGFDPAVLRFDHTVLTANGSARAALVRLRELAIRPIVVTDVPAMVDDGELSSPLLGMRFLQRMSTVEIKNDALTIRR